MFYFFTSSHRADLCHCCLYWRDDRTLLIGWADSVKVHHNKSVLEIENNHVIEKPRPFKKAYYKRKYFNFIKTI